MERHYSPHFRHLRRSPRIDGPDIVAIQALTRTVPKNLRIGPREAPGHTALMAAVELLTRSTLGALIEVSIDPLGWDQRFASRFLQQRVQCANRATSRLSG